MKPIELRTRREKLGITRIHLGAACVPPIRDGILRTWEDGAKPILEAKKLDLVLREFEKIYNLFRETTIDRVECAVLEEAGVDPGEDLINHESVIVQAAQQVHTVVSFNKDAHFWQVHHGATGVIPAALHRAAVSSAREILLELYDFETVLVNWNEISLEKKIAFDSLVAPDTDLVEIFRRA